MSMRRPNSVTYYITMGGWLRYIAVKTYKLRIMVDTVLEGSVGRRLNGVGLWHITASFPIIVFL